MNKRKRYLLLSISALCLAVFLFFSAKIFKNNDIFSYIANMYGGNSHPSVTIVKYGADWWHACEDMDVVLRNLEKKYGNRIMVKDIDIDSEDAREDMEKYDIRGVPFIVLFDENGEEIMNFVGDKSLEEFENLLKSKGLLN